MRTVNDPYGGHNPLIDKMIGNAYPIVRYVSCYLKEIRYVAENMESIHANATGTLRSQVLLIAATPSTTTSMEIPSHISTQDIQGVQVLIRTTSGAVYFPSTNTFTFNIVEGDLVITISDSAPTGIIGGIAKALITYQPTPED